MTTMRYAFLTDTYATERLKVLSVWSEFQDLDLQVRPRPDDSRGRSVLEHMVHQCVSEDTWFRTMLGIDVGEPWWEELVRFFDVTRSRAWVMTRRLAHTSHHRGQQMAMLRMLGRDLHSNYGPTADTGGLMQDHAPTIYAYSNLDALLEGEARGGAKSPLPAATGAPRDRAAFVASASASRVPHSNGVGITLNPGDSSE
jgi:uncharacterized damage-inducible protein DinB